MVSQLLSAVKTRTFCYQFGLFGEVFWFGAGLKIEVQLVSAIGQKSIS